MLAVVYPIEGVDQTAWPILRRSLAAARLAVGAVPVVLSAMTQEHERAVGGWQAEWVALPDAFRHAAGAVAHPGVDVVRIVVRPAHRDHEVGLDVHVAVLGGRVDEHQRHREEQRQHQQRSLSFFEDDDDDDGDSGEGGEDVPLRRKFAWSSSSATTTSFEGDDERSRGFWRGRVLCGCLGRGKGR